MLVIVEEEAELIWVYIAGGAVIGISLVSVVCICAILAKQKRKEAAELRSRKEGTITETWGIKTNKFKAKAREVEAKVVPFKGDKSLNNSSIISPRNDLSSQ